MSLRDRTLALAGLFQAARLVHQLAHDGRANANVFSTTIHSVLMIDANNTEEVFGGTGGLREGLEILQNKLSNSGATLDVEIARYAISMLHLAGRLARRTDMQEAIRHGIETAEEQMKFFEPSDDNVHPNLVEKLAEVYIKTLSTLAPRIMVSGEHGYLVNPLIAAKVRAALLAGVRAAFLWRQLGGQRWQLLLGRRGIAREAGKILEELRRH